MIPVTKPFLPPIEEYEKYLKGIWNRNWLTNNGPLVNELELESFARRALCLPLYDTLTTEEIDVTFRIIRRVQNN